MNTVPTIRIRIINSSPVRENGDFVLYWMIAHRRVNWNFSLDRAIEWAQSLNKPLLVLEALRCGYPWASDRFHSFVLDGMRDNLNTLKDSAVSYYPYMEPVPDAGKGLLRR